MNCERCRELLPEAIGEELDPRLAGEFRRHLADCADCRRELELLGRTASVLKSAWPEEPIPEPLTFGLPGRAAVAGRFGFGWGRPPRMAWLGLAAAACLVVFLGTLSFLNARVQIGQGSFTLAFGPEIPPPVVRQRRPPANPPPWSRPVSAAWWTGRSANWRRPGKPVSKRPWAGPSPSGPGSARSTSARSTPT